MNDAPKFPLGSLQSESDVPAMPWNAYCPKHGKVFNWVEVAHGADYPHNGRYCQKCYVENVLVPNCGKLTDVPSDGRG